MAKLEGRHPRSTLEHIEDDREALQRFYQSPLDRDYFDAWVTYLGGVFDYEPSAERIEGLYAALSEAKFSNAEQGLAGDWVVANCERFPVASHFLTAPTLSRNSMPQFRDEP